MNALNTIKAISDLSRVRILNILAKGEFTVQELTEALGSGQSTTSHHLKILQTAEVIDARRSGPWSLYGIADRPAAQFARNILRELVEDDKELFAKDDALAKDLVLKRREKLRSFFDGVANDWSAIREETHGKNALLDIVATRLDKESILLEVGCGSGSLLERTVPRIGATIGVDSSPVMLEQAKSLKVLQDSGVDLRLGYLEHLPLKSASIDIAVAFMVLHHLGDRLEALKDIRRVLKDSGRFWIIELSKPDDALMQRRFGELWHTFTHEDLSNEVQCAGFKDLTVERIGDNGEATLIIATPDPFIKDEL